MKLPVASLCPFPVGCIFDSAKALFEAVVPIEMHKEAIYDGLEQGLALHIDWEPIREVAEIDGTNKIHLHANFCQFLWMLNYCMLVICDCSQIKDGTAIDEDISPEKAEVMFKEALEMQRVGLLMFLGKVNNPLEMRVQRGELFSFANPVNKPNKYTDLASALTISGIAYLLQHEYAHFIKEHEESTPMLEAEADRHGFEKLIQWGMNQPYENVSLTGPMMALAATAFLNPKLVGTTHPDIDDRIASLFATYRDICKKEIPEGATKILIAALAYWSFALQHELPAIANDEDDMTYLRRIRETFIIPIKGKEKII